MLLSFSMVVVAFAFVSPVSVKADCKPFPSWTGKTGNDACSDAFGSTYRLTVDGYECCFHGFGKAEGRSIPEETEISPLKKRALGCRDGCQPYPSGSSKTGNNACIDAYGNMFRMSMDTWGDRCCPSGCGKAEGRSIEVMKRDLPPECKPYPSGSWKTGNNACSDEYGSIYRFEKGTWGKRCCINGYGKAEGRSIEVMKRDLPPECKPYPSGSWKTGNNACSDEYGSIYRFEKGTWGKRCCINGYGKAEGR